MVFGLVRVERDHDSIVCALVNDIGRGMAVLVSHYK
jgi:hypothetical protein